MIHLAEEIMTPLIKAVISFHKVLPPIILVTCPLILIIDLQKLAVKKLPFRLPPIKINLNDILNGNSLL